MKCEKCGGEYDDALTHCPFCQEGTGVEFDCSNSDTDENEASQEKNANGVILEEENHKSKPPVKKKNYDDMIREKGNGENLVLKSIVIAMVILIAIVGIGTFAYVQIGLKHDSTARNTQLVEKGATIGVSKGDTDDDIGKMFYVTGVTGTLPLRSQPSNSDYKIVDELKNGAVVRLEEKTSSAFWKVTDFVTEKEGYLAHTFLTFDEAKVMVMESKNAEGLAAFDTKESDIQFLCYVINAGEGIHLYSEKGLSEASILNTLVDGNTIGVVDDSQDDLWIVYDYSSSKYGFIESKFLTKDFDEVIAAKEAQQSEKEPEKEEKKEEKKGPEYVDTWSESGLSVRNGPTQETGTQVSRIEYGDVVEVVEKTNDVFWYVYIPDQDMYGYVKAACLSPVEETEE